MQKTKAKAKAKRPKANANGKNWSPSPIGGLISPMSVLDNVENFVIDVAPVVLLLLLLSLKQSQVSALATC